MLTVIARAVLAVLAVGGHELITFPVFWGPMSILRLFFDGVQMTLRGPPRGSLWLK